MVNSADLSRVINKIESFRGDWEGSQNPSIHAMPTVLYRIKQEIDDDRMLSHAGALMSNLHNLNMSFMQASSGRFKNAVSLDHEDFKLSRSGRNFLKSLNLSLQDLVRLNDLKKQLEDDFAKADGGQSAINTLKQIHFEP